MKKICALILSIIIIVGLVGCGIDNGSENGSSKLSGSYRDHKSDSRYLFNITDSGRGDYGGEMSLYNYAGELVSTMSWFIEDDIVYVDGLSTFRYNGEILYDFEHINGITVDENGKLDGNDDLHKKVQHNGFSFKSQNEGVFSYFEDFGMLKFEKGTYTVENNVVKMYRKDGSYFATYYIVNDKLYNTVLYPV